MRGEILSFDDVSGMGLISGDDGQRYAFDRAGFPGLGVPRAGQRVDFVASGDIATNIMPLAGETSARPGYTPGVAGSGSGLGSDIDWKHLMLSFEGRIRRSHFWIAWVILLAVGIVTSWLPLIGGLIGLLLIWPNLAISVKRLHDMGQTGWWVALPWVAGIILFFVGVGMIGMGAITTGQTWDDNPWAMMAVMGPAMGAFGLSALIGLGFLLWIGLMPGTVGPNRFGQDPKGGVAPETFD
ncbi:DUF805 domain-containing protein [Brevundimonas sp.]|uniref:DUF805 domain-containing protein n=1 Tax=Brevundimonas sp. TaxID=1871086 RepID=UPI0035B13B92